MSCVNTFAYDLSAFLGNILSPLTGNSDFTVTNSAHFASIISSEKIQDNEIMVSFDVESLFTNVPIEGAVQAARRKLESDPGIADRSTLTPAGSATSMTPSPSLIAVRWPASYTISTVSNPPSALPWKPRKRVRSPSSTRQFLEDRTAALPPASTDKRPAHCGHVRTSETAAD